MRRAVLPWLVAAGLLLAVTGVGVVAANATVFGPSAFVRVYLDAIARGDAVGAMTVAGVDPGEADTALLRRSLREGLTDLREVSVRAEDGADVVTYAWRADGTTGTTAFEVRRVGTRFGLFPEWAFAASPVATVDVAAMHDPRFRVNGVDARDAGDPVALLVPAVYEFDHRSALLESDPVTLVADTVAQRAAVTVEPRPTAAFVDLVDERMRESLDACATQQVLLPAGCPFGEEVTDRIVSTPTWSIAEYPAIDVTPGSALGRWVVPPSEGRAHLVVDIRSIFDGTVRTFDEDVPFELSYEITVADDDRVTIGPPAP